VFTVFVLLLSTGAFMNLSLPSFQELSGTAGMLGMQILWSLIYVVTVYLFFRNCDQPLRTFFSEWPLVALCALAMMSIFWSQAPGLTFRRSIALLLTLLFGVYFGSRFSLKQQLRLLAWTCWICVVFSFLFGLLGLGTSVDAGEGVSGWYGIFVQKGNLGETMLISALVFLLWGQEEPEHKGSARAGFLASLVLIALSRSTSSVVALVLLLALLPYLNWTSRKSARWTVAGIGFLAAAGTASLVYVATHLEQVTGLLGKSATLTGRIQIWILSTVMALRRPWLGYGYSAFWLQDQGPTVRIWNTLGWDAPHAHNGFLELWLELGVVGVVLFLLVFVYYAALAIRHLRRHRGARAAAWPLLFLCSMLLLNLTGVTFLSRNSIFSILLGATVVVTRVRRDPAYAPAVLGGASPGLA
jgi:exopolysaccharide production protein ExoQ